MKPTPSSSNLLRLLVATLWLAAIPTGNCIAEVLEHVESLADGRTGKFSYPTLNRRTTIPDLQKGRIFMNETATAVLNLPSKGQPPYPVMVIAHSSAGVKPNDYEWANWFNQMGIATIVIDTFSPRGIKHTANDQSQLNYGATVGEYLVALKLIATHPKIDVKRIGIIGFSRGGVAATAVAIESVRRGVVGSDLRYAVHFPIYGGCLYRANDWTRLPVHMFVGTEDSYESLDRCRNWAEHVKASGGNVELTIFDGAHHGYDNSAAANKVLRFFPEAEHWKPCETEWNVDTRRAKNIINPEWHSDANLASEQAGCKTKGVTVKYDEAATNQTKQIIEGKLMALGFVTR